jgi:hypothetical protein
MLLGCFAYHAACDVGEVPRVDVTERDVNQLAKQENKQCRPARPLSKH